jgi:long-chain acyl-CoA synthetase
MPTPPTIAFAPPAAVSLPLAARLDAALAATPPDGLFLDSPDGRLTWGALRDRIDAALESFAALDLVPGDRALISLGDETLDAPLFLACLRAGVTAVLVDRAATDEELCRLVAAARPAALWLRAERAAAAGRVAAPIPPPRPSGRSRAAGAIPDPESIGVIVFTSGTTSRPKGVALSHRALAAQLDVFTHVYGFGADTRLLNPLPLHHVDGLVRGVLAAAATGAELHRPARFAVQTLDAWIDRIARSRITHLVAVPTLLSLMLRFAAPTRLRLGGADLRCVICSADALDARLWQAFEDRFGVPVINVWGQSETTCDALFAGPDAATRRPGAIGRPVGCEARIVDASGVQAPVGAPGELEIRGPIVMSFYLDDPQATAEVMHDGWLRTGDIASCEVDGLYRFAGRLRTVIVSRGVSVHPENVNAALLGAPDVAEAATVGLADADRGQRIVACVAPAPGATLDAEALHALCRRTLSPEKRPQQIRVLPALPRGAAGKVNLEALIAILTEAEPAAPAAPPSVLAVAAELFAMHAQELSADSTPFNTTAWDSLMHVALIEALEVAFGVVLAPQDIIGLATLGDAEEIVARLLATAGPGPGAEAEAEATIAIDVR